MIRKPNVFISHASKNNKISRILADNLKRDGAKVWYDQFHISPGDSFHEKMNEGLEQCEVMVLIWSKEAESSPEVKREWDCALSANKKIIPYFLDDTKLPVILGNLAGIFHKEGAPGYQKLVRVLNLTHAPETLKIDQVPVFRNYPMILSRHDVKAMIKKNNFYCKEYEHTKKISNPNSRGSEHYYKLDTIQGDKIIYDKESDLMWQQSGSEEPLDYQNSIEWIKNLNESRFAGFRDWRLPTLEEAMSLLEPAEKSGGLNIDVDFDRTQSWIWTADQEQFDENSFWIVEIMYAYCESCNEYVNVFVRAVRSGQSSQG